MIAGNSHVTLSSIFFLRNVTSKTPSNMLAFRAISQRDKRRCRNPGRSFNRPIFGVAQAVLPALRVPVERALWPRRQVGRWRRWCQRVNAILRNPGDSGTVKRWTRQLSLHGVRNLRQKKKSPPLSVDCRRDIKEKHRTKRRNSLNS